MNDIFDELLNTVHRSNERNKILAENANIIGALQELSIGVGLPNIIIGRVYDEKTGEEKDWALHPKQIIGLMDIIKNHVEEMATYGMNAVNAYNNQPHLLDTIKQLKDKVVVLEAQNNKYRKYLGE